MSNGGTPIKLDCSNLRTQRQKLNNKNINEILKGDDLSRTKLNKLCNDKSLQRVLNELKEYFPDLNDKEIFTKFLDKCKKDDIYRMGISGRISKDASKQSSIDEKIVLETCNETTSKFGIRITQMGNTDLRPHKTSNRLLTKQDYNKGKKNKEGKDKIKKNDCLKSFDGKVENSEGKTIGYISAKVCMGCGGHQDNVFEELHTFGEWAEKYADKLLKWIILIDTNLKKEFTELKTKYDNIENIHVVDHIGLQKLFIPN